MTRIALAGERTHWVAVSQAVKESLASLRWLPTESVQVIWNGVDLEKFRPASGLVKSPRPIVGVAARLAPMKGIEHLIEAVSALRSRGIVCDLRVAGEGPSRRSLEALAQSLGASEHITFLGQINDMPSFYKSLDVLVLPSVSTEGLPLSILEAMACGLPVVSTTISGIPEVIENGVTGALVPARDAAALAGALEPLLLSYSLRVGMGREGRRRVETLFSLDRMLDEVAGLYSTVVPH